jgi:hypothetical protein
MLNEKSIINSLGLEFYQQVIYLSLIPIGLVGIGLNISTFLILKGRQFRLPVIHYLRVYTINNCFLCFLISTVILCHIHKEWSIKYYAHIYIPFLNLSMFYQTSLDTVLTLDRSLTFTTKFERFKQFKPRLVSMILLVISIVMSSPFWFTFGTMPIEIQSNETEKIVIHSLIMKPSSIFFVANFIFNIIPFVVELPLNIATMILLKKYLKRRVHFRIARPPNHPDGFLLQQENRIRKMEMKVTFLVVILSLFSFM